MGTALHAFVTHDKKDGVWNFYAENEKKSFEGFFKNGLKDSVHQIFHDNGRLYILEKYKLGVKIGNWEYHDSITGEVTKTEKYSD